MRRVQRVDEQKVNNLFGEPVAALDCSHLWMDPTEPPAERAPYSPVMGSKRREMKPGVTYVCSNCGRRITAPGAREP